LLGNDRVLTQALCCTCGAECLFCFNTARAQPCACSYKTDKHTPY
jgi:hypothetical protein